MSRKLDGKRGAECFTTRFPLSPKEYSLKNKQKAYLPGEWCDATLNFYIKPMNCDTFKTAVFHQKKNKIKKNAYKFIYMLIFSLIVILFKYNPRLENYVNYLLTFLFQNNKVK